MKLNKSTSHAIRILVDCAHADGALVKAADLSAHLDMTMQNVFKIVHILSRAELLMAVRGRNGGVRLARPAGEVRVGDIVRAMETTELELDEGDQRASPLSRGVNKVLDSALEAFIGILDQHTLADIAGRTGSGTPAARKTARRAAAPPDLGAGRRRRASLRSSRTRD